MTEHSSPVAALTVSHTDQGLLQADGPRVGVGPVGVHKPHEHYKFCDTSRAQTRDNIITSRLH
jgi:hypothetical protein